MTRPMDHHPFAEIERRWQLRWQEAGIFQAERDETRPKWFIVELPPFTNGRLHLGHVRNYALADVSARFRRMAGFNVLYTTGYDSFGLPTEHAAYDAGCHPREFAERSIADMGRQFIRLGLSHDLRRVTVDHDHAVYRWVQWVFLRLFEGGYVFRQKARANWCDGCRTTLADSLVNEGRCWRCQQLVTYPLMEQWFMRETSFADELLSALPGLTGWPEAVKRLHRQWIGRHEVVALRLKLAELDDVGLDVLLREPALVSGMTFVGVSWGNPIVDRLRCAGVLGPNVVDGSAVLLGVHVLHPLTGKPIPVVGMDSLEPGDEAIGGCPAHVRSDRNVAHALKLDAPRVVYPPAGGSPETDAADFDDTWIVRDGGLLDGCTVAEARARGLAALQASGVASATVRTRLRDWNLARQRYWGAPVPIVHCDVCGVVAVPDCDLPVVLPEHVDLSATENALRNDLFVPTCCPRCRRPSRRDTDTLGPYASPWWYHLYCRTSGRAEPFLRADTRYWMPVDLMVGGIDQARTCFFHTRTMARALRRLGHTLHDEPVEGLVAVGMVNVDGRKMSKREGNVVEADELMSRYGADAVRMGMLGAAAPATTLNWSIDPVRHRAGFLRKLVGFVHTTCVEVDWSSVARCDASAVDPTTKLRRRLVTWLETASRSVTKNYVRHDLHLAIKNVVFLYERIVVFHRAARERCDPLEALDDAASHVAVSILLRLLTPLAPHICEELWQHCGGTTLIASMPWPVAVDDPGHHPRLRTAGVARKNASDAIQPS